MRTKNCLTCLRETDDYVPMMDESKHQQTKTLNGSSSFRSTVVAKHFWFDQNDLLQGFLCTRCWSKIEEFHWFYCEIEEAHEHKIFLPFFEVKEEMPDVDEEEEKQQHEQEGCDYSFSQELTESKQEGETHETTVDSTNEGGTVSMDEEHLIDEDVEEQEEEEEDEEKSVRVTKVGKRRKLNPADIPQVDELIAKYCNMHCDQCPLTFDSLKALQIHAVSEHKRRAHVFCCDRRFSTRIRLYEHVLCHVNPEQFQCDICKRNFIDGDALNKHKLKVHIPIEERPFKCDRCAKTFILEWMLIRHQREHRALEQKEFSCKHCNKYYANSAVLKQHLKNMHSTTFDYVCDHCAKGFNKKDRFLRHMQHHGPKVPKDKAQCPICSHWLLKESLKNHIVRHNSSPYQCETCGKKSPNILAHKSHVRSAHSEARLAQSNARFTCNICGKDYKMAQTLKEHIASHNKEVLYTCPHCPKTFYSNANMHSHRKRQHYQEWLATRRRIITK